MSTKINGHSPDLYRAGDLLRRAGDSISRLRSDDEVPGSLLYQSALEDVSAAMALLDPNGDVSGHNKGCSPSVDRDVSDTGMVSPNGETLE